MTDVPEGAMPDPAGEPSGGANSAPHGPQLPGTAPDPLLRARALVLHDLAAYGAATADVVSLVEDVVADRRWWVQEWPEGGAYVAGQIAQDVQDRLMDTEGRWPTCRLHVDEPLGIQPELGPDPHWVCQQGCGVVAALGALGR